MKTNWKNIIDFVMLMLSLTLFMLYFIIEYNLTIIFGLFMIYILFIIVRFDEAVKVLDRGNKEIKKLNQQIQEKNEFIIELIEKYGNPEEGKKFINDIKKKL